MSESQDITKRLRHFLGMEAEAISGIPLDKHAERAVNSILNCSGKLFTTGIGKCGYIARKTASTFCTTGTPSVFLHPADASHGDVGVVSHNDILLTFSNSGKTREIAETIICCRNLGVSCVITMTGNPSSPLAEQSDIILNLGVIPEACPLALTPTASTAAMMAFSDALALAVMELRGFSKEDWALRHHSGYLGQKSRGLS